MRCQTLLLALMVFATPAFTAEPRADTASNARFALRANFQPEPKAVENGRYSLRGQFTREAQASPPLEAVGFDLNAEFAPKGSCVIPTLLFKNGFESTP